jgi:hypothetical protein
MILKPASKSERRPYSFLAWYVFMSPYLRTRPRAPREARCVSGPASRFVQRP